MVFSRDLPDLTCELTAQSDVRDAALFYGAEVLRCTDEFAVLEFQDVASSTRWIVNVGHRADNRLVYLPSRTPTATTIQYVF